MTRQRPLDVRYGALEEEIEPLRNMKCVVFRSNIALPICHTSCLRSRSWSRCSSFQ